MSTERRGSQSSLISDRAPELTGCGATICCNPYRGLYRFIALVFICFLAFGSYFCYDNPAALADNMMEDLHLSKSQYSVLYSVYSWPNVILSLFGGYLIDKVFGIRWGAIIFSFFIMAGQLVFAAGALVNSFWLMVIGRLIFSCGGENLAVAQNAYTVAWFRGKELNTVFGIQLSFARVGSTVNMYVMKPMYNAISVYFTGYRALGTVLFIAGVSTIVSWLCAVILAALDKRNEKYMAYLKKDEAPAANNISHAESAEVDGVVRQVDGTEDSESKSEKVKGAIMTFVRDILRFPATLWLLCIICVAYYVAIFPLVSFGLSQNPFRQGLLVVVPGYPQLGRHWS